LNVIKALEQTHFKTKDSVDVEDQQSWKTKFAQNKDLPIVLFPAPDDPTKAVVEFAGIFKETSFSTSSFGLDG